MKSSVVIIGGGIGGISAGIELALQNYDVTIYEKNSSFGGRANQIIQKGYRFDTGPSLLNYPHLFKKTFKKSGKDINDYLELIEVKKGVFFEWPNGENFNWSSNLINLSENMKFFSEEDKNQLINFISDSYEKLEIAFEHLITKNSDNPLSWLGNVGLRNIKKLGITKNMSQQINMHIKNKKISEAIGSYAMYLGGRPESIPGIFSILPTGEITYGLWHPKGGFYELIKALLQLANDLGVNIKNNSDVEEIIIKDNKVDAIRVNNKIIKSEIIISNLDKISTNKLIERKNKLKISENKINYSPAVITFYLGINKKLDKLPHHKIFLSKNMEKSYDSVFKDGKVPQDPPFYISSPSATDESMAPKDCSNIFILVPVPTIDKKKYYNQKEISDIRKKIFKRLELSGSIIDERFIDFEEIWTPNDWAEKFSLTNGSAFGESHNFFNIGPFRSKNYSKKIKNLFFTGSSTTPGTGVPMCLISGQMAAERIKKLFD